MLADALLVGDGLNGYPQICHGGFVATMLDEVCGILIVLNMEKSIERVKESGGTSTPSMNYMTACELTLAVERERR